MSTVKDALNLYKRQTGQHEMSTTPETCPHCFAEMHRDETREGVVYRFECGNSPNGPNDRTARCFQRQLAAVTSERDWLKAYSANLLKELDAFRTLNTNTK